MAKKDDAMREGVAALFKKAPQKPPKEKAPSSNNRVVQPPPRTKLGMSSAGGRPRRDNPHDHSWPASRTTYTSNAYDVAQYALIRNIAKKENVPIKEVLYQFLQIGLERYQAGAFDFDYYKID
jgi:hypothetical protein